MSERTPFPQLSVRTNPIKWGYNHLIIGLMLLGYFGGERLMDGNTNWIWAAGVVIFLYICFVVSELITFAQVDIFENRIEKTWRWGLGRRNIQIQEISLIQVFQTSETYRLKLYYKGGMNSFIIKDLNEDQLRGIAILLKRKGIKVEDPGELLFDKPKKRIIPNDPALKQTNRTKKRIVLKKKTV